MKHTAGAVPVAAASAIAAAAASRWRLPVPGGRPRRLGGGGAVADPAAAASLLSGPDAAGDGLASADDVAAAGAGVGVGGRTVSVTDRTAGASLPAARSSRRFRTSFSSCRPPRAPHPPGTPSAVAH